MSHTLGSDNGFCPGIFCERGGLELKAHLSGNSTISNLIRV